MGAKTFAFYFVTSILAILVGLTLTNIIQPGVGVEISGSVQSFDSSSLQKPSSLGEIIIRMIPLNPIAAMANGDMLGVIFWSIVFGFAITRLTGRPQEMMTHFFDYGFQAMMKLTHGIITLLPIGVFGLITKAVATTGFDLFKYLPSPLYISFPFFPIPLAIGIIPLPPARAAPICQPGSLNNSGSGEYSGIE